MRDLRDLLSGPPPALPDLLDHVAERWAAAPPRLRWTAVGLVVVLALGVVGRGAVASPWGAPVDVIVAATDLPPGHRLGPGDLTTASWPEHLAPTFARSPDEVVGAVTHRALPAGTPIGLDDVSDGGLADGLPAGRAVVVIVDPTAPPVTPGWRVDVVAQGFDGVASVLARGARVLAVDGEAVWLDVARDEAPEVVAASARGDARSVLLPPE